MLAPNRPLRRLVRPAAPALALAALLAAQGAGAALAATPIYVRPGGSDTACNGEFDLDEVDAAPDPDDCAVATIQKGVDLVDVGGTVNVAAGTYSEDVAIGAAKDGISIVGAGEGSTTIDVAGHSGGGWQSGISIEADDVTLEGFTMESDGAGPPTSPRYGVRFLVVSGGTLQHVTITDLFRSGVDAPSVSDMTFDDITATDNGGNGLGLRDISDSTISNITTSGNAWGGIRIQTHEGPLDGVVISGTNSFGEDGQFDGGGCGCRANFGLYLEQGNDDDPTPGPPYPITYGHTGTPNVLLQSADFAYALGGGDNESPQYDRIWLFKTLASATAAATAAEANWPDHLVAPRFITDIADGEYWVDDGTVDMLIQDAIDEAGGEATINVLPGTYAETVTLLEDDTVLTGTDPGNRPSITGGIVADKNNTTLRNLVVTGVGAGSNIIRVSGTDFTMERVIVDGEDVVGRHGVGGGQINGDISVTYSEFLNIKNWAAFDTRSGSGGPTTGADLDTVVFSNNVVRDTQGHIAIRGTIGDPTTSVVMNDNLVEEIGSATNSFGGILKVFYATTVTFSGNTVKDVGTSGYNPAGEASYGAGFMPRGVEDLTVTDNTFQNNNQAIAIEPRNSEPGGFPDGVLPSGSISDNTFTNNTYGVYVPATLHPSSDFTDLTVTENRFSGSTSQAVHNGYASGILRAEENWWGSACGPSGAGLGNGDAVSTFVDYSPWWADALGASTASEGAGGTIVVPAGSSTAQIQAILDCAAGSTVVFATSGSPYPGGLVVTGNGTTIDLNGQTVGPGSPAFTVAADDVTIAGPGTLDGGGSGDPAILVQAGADNAHVHDVEIMDWADGVQVAGDVTSFKLIGNWIHDNADAGLQIDAGASLGGIVTIEGNLFKANGGNGIENDGDTTPLPAEYNGWGHVDGPASGDGVSGGVDADPWTYVEPYLDMEPDTDATEVSVSEGSTFTVELKAVAENVNAIAFELNYDTAHLTLSSTTFVAPWVGKCSNNGSGPGVLRYYCSLEASEWDGGTIAELGFTASNLLVGNGPWITLLDLAHDEADTSAAATGGAKVFVDNAGYGAPSVPERDITDGDDGEVTIVGKANYNGFVDLQGRGNDGGATVRVYNQATKVGAIELANGTSAGSGSYATAHIGLNELLIGSTYHLLVDRDLFVATTPQLDASYAHSKLLSTRPLTALSTLVLRGGDAYNDNVINISDASCIGTNYGTMASMCGGGSPAGSSPDVNEDGTVNILDLALMGGNYGIASSTWAP